MPAKSSRAAPWLSVVMPTHLGGEWFGATLDSLAGQSDRDFECLIIDSSPNGEALALARPYADRLNFREFRRPDLEHWRSKTNFGFQEARADFVSMLHQDDVWRPGRAAALRGWIAAAPDMTMHLHPTDIIDGRGERLGTLRCPWPADGAPLASDRLLESLLVQNFISVPTPAIRRDAFLAVGGIDEALWYTGDWDLYLKLARHGPFAYHAQALSGFRIHGQSLTVSGSRDPAAFESQMRGVLATHIQAVSPSRREPVLRVADASIAVNTRLAAAMNGDRAAANLAAAAGTALGLGPAMLYDYLRNSRLAERFSPRLRARLAGGL